LDFASDPSVTGGGAVLSIFRISPIKADKRHERIGAGGGALVRLQIHVHVAAVAEHAVSPVFAAGHMSNQRTSFVPKERWQGIRAPIESAMARPQPRSTARCFPVEACREPECTIDPSTSKHIAYERVEATPGEVTCR
jgi:hypothetical protein